MKPIDDRLLALAPVLLRAGCADEIRTRYRDLPQAPAQGALDPGEQPPVLPASIRQIVQQNNLDLNACTNTFADDPSERTSSWKRLIQIGIVRHYSVTHDLVILRRNGPRWPIELYRPTGRERYNISPL